MAKGGLYIVATPIGNLKDITLRAIDTLKACDLIACEDTRVSRKLLTTYSIDKPLISYHDHNADKMRPAILEKIKQGQAVALISDAGTPLISDPGYKLVRDCYQIGLEVTFLPGPSAVLAGLVLSGLPSDKFFFAGFADKKNYGVLTPIPATIVFFESAKRLQATLKSMALHFSNRPVAVIREMTKRFEEVRRGSFEELIQFYQENGPPKGEVVVVLGPPEYQQALEQDLDKILKKALKEHPLKDACTLVAGMLGIPRKQVYQRALNIKKEQ